jgi:hypothetical protein
MNIARSHYQLRRLLAVAPLVLVLSAGIALGAPLAAVASVSSTSRTALVAQGYNDVNAIRSYYFCDSAACKKDKAAAEKKSAAAIDQLDVSATTLTPASSPKDQKTVVAKFDADVLELQKVSSVYTAQTSETQIAQNTGILYYETANIYSDLYLLSSDITHTTPHFSTWSFGPEAVLYTMQVDTQALNAKSATVALDVATNVDLLQDAKALTADADGPNKGFNELIVKFAKTQTTVSAAENAVFEKKKPAITDKELKADITLLESQFENIATQQKALSK